jgi:hypothetical protein
LPPRNRGLYERGGKFFSKLRVRRFSYNEIRRISAQFLREFHPESSMLKFGSLDEWKQFQREVDEADYNWLEYQAYAFAGLVLVPTEHLKAQFQSAAESAERIGFTRQGEPEAFLEYVTEVLREVFQVSDAVIAKRLRYENLDRKETNHVTLPPPAFCLLPSASDFDCLSLFSALHATCHPRPPLGPGVFSALREPLQ